MDTPFGAPRRWSAGQPDLLGPAGRLGFDTGIGGASHGALFGGKNELTYPGPLAGASLLQAGAGAQAGELQESVSAAPSHASLQSVDDGTLDRHCGEFVFTGPPVFRGLDSRADALVALPTLNRHLFEQRATAEAGCARRVLESWRPFGILDSVVYPREHRRGPGGAIAAVNATVAVGGTVLAARDVWGGGGSKGHYAWLMLERYVPGRDDGHEEGRLPIGQKRQRRAPPAAGPPLADEPSEASALRYRPCLTRNLVPPTGALGSVFVGCLDWATSASAKAARQGANYEALATLYSCPGPRAPPATGAAHLGIVRVTMADL